MFNGGLGDDSLTISDGASASVRFTGGAGNDTLTGPALLPERMGGEGVEHLAKPHGRPGAARTGGVARFGRVLAAGLVNRHRSRHLIKEAIEDTGRHVVHELERFLNTLGTIAGISPLLGLLGTVIGMIKVFSAIMAHGVGNANQLAGGISEALITTAAGLTVAIPSFFFYRYFKGKVESYVVSMEEQAINLIEAIERGNVAQLGSGVPGG